MSTFILTTEGFFVGKRAIWGSSGGSLIINHIPLRQGFGGQGENRTMIREKGLQLGRPCCFWSPLILLNHREHRGHRGAIRKNTVLCYFFNVLGIPLLFAYQGLKKKL